MEPTTIGAIASGVGSLASSIFGNKGPSPEEQINHNLNYERKRLDLVEGLTIPTRVAAARKAGLHPLSALGVSPSSGSIGINYDQPSGPDFEALGQGIDRALSVGKNATEKRLDQLALEKAQLENDYLRTQIAGSQKAILDSASVPAVDSTYGVSRSRTQRNLTGQISDTIKHAGIDPVSLPRHKLVTDLDKKQFKVLNPDVGDNEFMMALDFIGRTLPDLGRNNYQRYVTDKNADGRKLYNKARQFSDWLASKHPLKTKLNYQK